MSEPSGEYRNVADGSIDAMAAITRLSFALPSHERAVAWLRDVPGVERRGWYDAGGTLRSSLIRIPMGIYLGGRSVGLTGIAAVGVAMAERGRGAAKAIMRETVRESAAAGVPLVGLYASTQRLYRSVGFEQAGVRCEVKVRGRDVNAASAAPDVRPAERGRDFDAMRRCYDAMAAQRNGYLDRGPYVWERVFKRHEEEREGFVVESVDEPGELDGYIYFVEKSGFGRESLGEPANRLFVSDFAYRNARGADGVLRVLGSFGTVVGEIAWFGSADEPLIMRLDHQFVSTHVSHRWMLRIADVAGAVGGRGYAPGVRGTVMVHVRDELVGQNAGTWRIEVAGGRGSAEKIGGSDAGGNNSAGEAVSLDVRWLAAVYTGYANPHMLRTAGLIDGPDGALDTLAAVFAPHLGAPAQSDLY